MRREEFLQQLWLDYIHLHPELGAVRLWPTDATPEYLVLLTLNHGPFSTEALLPALHRFGYRSVDRYAMADRGLLVTLLAPPNEGAWLVLSELQIGTLTREPRQSLESLVEQTHSHDQGPKALCRGRPWPMPTWDCYQRLQQAQPLAAWLAVMGPRLHHAGFDCERLGVDLNVLDRDMYQAGLIGSADRQQSAIPVSSLLSYRFYPTCSRRLPFAAGDEHRVALGGIALVQKCVPDSRGRAVEFLLPHHTRCRIA